MPINVEVDPRFIHLLTKLGIRKDVANQLWKSEIRSPQELASSEIEDIRLIANNPVLVNVVLPAMQKHVFAITMASDPYEKTLEIFEKLSGGDHKMDVDIPAPTMLQSDGRVEEPHEAHQLDEQNIPVVDITDATQSTNTYVLQTPTVMLGAGPTSETAPQQQQTSGTAARQPSNHDAAPPGTQGSNNQNGRSQHIQNTNMYVGASGTGQNRVRMHQNQTHYETDALRAGSGNRIVITGGNFVQANLLGRSTFHNVGSHIETTLGDADDLAVRRKTRLNSSFYMNGELVPTAELLWREGEFWLDRVNVQPSTMEQYNQHFADENVYPVNNWGQSEALIINNVTFTASNIPSRSGADKDTKVMKEMVEQLGFNATAHENKQGEQIRQIFREFTKSQALYKSSMVLIYIGSHGERDRNGNDVFLGSDDERVPLNDIVDMFSNTNCRALRNKPKLFFFQFCRKDNPNSVPSTSASTQQDGSLLNQAAAGQQTLHKISDVLQAFSTRPGQQAYRDTSDGSWFVTALSKVLAGHAHKEDLLSMLTMVNNSVSVNRGRDNGKLVVQLSEFSSNLTKKVYFYPRNQEQQQQQEPEQ